MVCGDSPRDVEGGDVVLAEAADPDTIEAPAGRFEGSKVSISLAATEWAVIRAQAAEFDETLVPRLRERRVPRGLRGHDVTRAPG